MSLLDNTLTPLNFSPSNTSKIKELKELDALSLKQLIDGEILAIRIPDYICEKTSRSLNHYINETVNLEEYSHETYEEGNIIQNFYGVHRWGTPFNSTYGKATNAQSRDKYYADAAQMRRLIDSICAPENAPIQELIEHVQRIWPDGAATASFQGEPMFCGIIRAMFPETAHLSETTPHVDCLPFSIAALEQQFSANIYIQIPPSGGELITWDTQPFSYAEIKKFEGIQLPKERLLKPLHIHPRKNELVIFNTRRPHAICGFDSGKRISIQSFIGYTCGQPLQFWC